VIVATPFFVAGVRASEGFELDIDGKANDGLKAPPVGDDPVVGEDDGEPTAAPGPPDVSLPPALEPEVAPVDPLSVGPDPPPAVPLI
jgi:hypothetical protein